MKRDFEQPYQWYFRTLEDWMKVFHSAGFCSEAEKNGHGGKKSVRTSEKFIEEGAPVIENYADFVAVRKNAPGFKVCKNKGQLEFFDSC